MGCVGGKDEEDSVSFCTRTLGLGKVGISSSFEEFCYEIIGNLFSAIIFFYH